jgi:hypothetical protein
VLLVGGSEAQRAGAASRDGATPPMRDARRRMFAPSPEVDPALMQRLEEDVFTIAMVRAQLCTLFSRWMCCAVHKG